MNKLRKQARWWQLMALMAGIVALIVMMSQSDGQSAVLAASGIEWPELELVSVATGLSSPVHITHAGDGSGRLFIVLQGGQIRILENGTLLGTSFLNISSLISNGSEQGLLGLAFSPNYASNGEFYVNYTNTSGDTRIARYQVSDDPNVADPESAEIVLSVNQDFSNHNGGQVAFGPDGYLYIGMGDGGSAGDPNNRAQDPTQLLGKILRIDIETDNPSTYTIPPDNPFVDDSSTLDEIWALGVRNPWRFSFDRLTGDMYIADVGQNQWEEIDFQPAESTGGENYGWRCYEGNHAYNTAGCGAMSDYDFPVTEISHSGGNCSVTGGHVYRGGIYPRMEGVYFYADYCSGNLWGLQYTGESWQDTLLTNGDFGITSFGEDEAGNLYLVQGSTLYELTDPNGPTPTPTGSMTATNTPTLTPTASVTATNTPTPTLTGSVTAVNTPTPTLTGSVTAVNTPTNTPTASVTATNTPTNTPTASLTATNTPPHTPTASVTATNTPPPTSTGSVTATNTPPPTSTGSVTATAIPSTTPTNSPTAINGGIGGTVMASDGSPLSGILVQAYQEAAEWDVAAQASTTLSGTYSLENLMPGSYRLYFTDASQTYASEYYNDTTIFDNSQSIVVKKQFISDIDATLDAAAPAVATTEGDGIVNVDPQTGELTIGVQNNADESITITVPVTCEAGTPSKVMLMLGDNGLTMTSDGENNYSVTLNIPADLPNAEGPFDIEVTYDCNGQANMTQIGQLTLYDPSGTIRDRTTGEVIAGATVNLYYLTDSTPDTEQQKGDCRTINTRPDVNEDIYGAWSGLEAAFLSAGIWVNPAVLTINSTQAISPTINPQTTGNHGRYGWDVAEGCWYVVVEADGYESLISPLVGVPPEVTDLDIALAPVSRSMELYLPIISRGDKVTR